MNTYPACFGESQREADSFPARHCSLQKHRSNLFHISGTDIVRCLAFRFQAFGRPVKNSKKFEEGIFSDLRNLKAGNDATLEEPKSAFLDFLYKNNCIRTQKKQKVFYWYSVPHDRLFLDALERDLKREKAGQEATTTATFEPALSFEFDASQSLFEQLTKAQQGSGNPQNGAGPFGPGQENFSTSVSPAMHAVDSMPPPPMVSQALQSVPQEALDANTYGQSSVPVTSGPVPAGNEQNGPMPYDRNGMPVSMPNPRHSSVPAYMEYSPAPSFVSSQGHYDEYSNRAMSYEPITPPQQVPQYNPDTSYPSTEDNGLYNALNDMSGYNSVAQAAGANFGAQYNGMGKSFTPNSVNPMIAHIEGSPNYKQRRRRSPSAQPYGNGVSASMGQAGVPAAVPRPVHGVKRPSDLRRSISTSVDFSNLERAASGPPAAYNYMGYQDHTPDLSRQGSPMPSTEDQQQSTNAMMQQHRYGNLMNDGYGDSMQGGGPGAFRRARSATTTDVGPYPQKSHSCPIPSCGRLFKRLEHLKR